MTELNPIKNIALSWPLYRWMIADTQWEKQPLATKIGLAWQAAWGSANARLSESLAAQAPSLRLDDPIFIVGPWRSGTTVMHELLTAATGMPTPRTWQCMNPCSFQIANNVRKAEYVARPMDGLKIGSDSPQEDEFALLLLGISSAYRAFLMPHRIGELLPTLEQEYWLSKPEWRLSWENFLAGVLRCANSLQPLILKSPNHTFRLRSILQRFPRARLVWMTRDATSVFHSNRKMWQMMAKMYGRTSFDKIILDEFLTQAMVATADTLNWCAKVLPQEQCVVVSQEQLLTDPDVTVRAVLQRLGLEMSEDNNILLSQAISRTHSGRVESYSHDVSSGTASVLSALDELQFDGVKGHNL